MDPTQADAGPEPERARWRRWPVVLAAAAGIAVIGGVVPRSSEPRAVAGPAVIRNPDGIRPWEGSLVIEVTEEWTSEDGEMPSRKREEILIPTALRAVEGGVEETVTRNGADVIARWQADGVYAVAGPCPYEPHYLDVQFPLKPEIYPEQRSTYRCEDDDPVSFTIRKTVTGREVIELAGRSWDTWVMTRDTVWTSGDRWITETKAWFSPELGEYVKVLSVTKLPRGIRYQRTETLLRVLDPPGASAEERATSSSSTPLDRV